jgi:hypothetical protein
MNWKVLLWADRGLFWVFLALLISSSFKRLNVPIFARERRDARVYFGLSWIGYCANGMVAAMVPALLRSMHRPGSGSAFDLFAWVIAAALLIIVVFDVPNTILVSQEGVEQVRWFLPNRRIAWTEIVEIDAEKNEGALTLRTAKRRKIVHGLLQADRPRFLLEIKKHCGSELPCNRA